MESGDDDAKLRKLGLNAAELFKLNVFLHSLGTFFYEVLGKLRHEPSV